MEIPLLLLGLCEGHNDAHGIMESNEEFYRKKEPNLFVHGDILGTFMAWLSDTKEGGATAFISPGSEGLIMPDRGSAAFWYSLQSDGYRDQSARHAGCPVIMGSKWILNKWLYWYDNFKKFPCDTKNNKLFNHPCESHYL